MQKNRPLRTGNGGQSCYCPTGRFTNMKLLLKIAFLLFVLFVLVLLGRENRGTVDFTLPPLLPNKITLPSAIMYYVFFAIGVVTGSILTAGMGKSEGKGGGSSSGKSGK